MARRTRDTADGYSRRQITEIAVRARRDVRSVAAALRGEADVRSSTRLDVERAARELGVTHPHAPNT